MVGGAASIRDLVRMVIDPASAEAFHNRVDMATRQILEVLCVLGPTVSTARLESTLNCPPEVLKRYVTRLNLAGMALLDGDNVEVNPGLDEAVPCPCNLGPPAALLLERLSNREMAAIAGCLELSTTGAKPALASRLVAALADREFIEGVLRKAPQGTDKLIEAATTQWPVFTLPWGAETVRYRGDLPAGWCLQRGLLLATDYTTAVMPREVGLALRRGRPLAFFDSTPPEMGTRSVDQEHVDGQGAEAALALVADVGAICEIWSATPAKLLRSGGIGVREVRKLAKLLKRSEEHVAWIVDLASVAGLVDWDRADEVAAPAPGYDEWSLLDAPRRWAVLAQTWMFAPFDLSIAGTLDEDGKSVPPLLDRSLDADFVLRRVLVCEMLAEPGPGWACDPVGLATLAHWRRPGAWEDDPDPPAVLVERLLAESTLVGLSAGGSLSSFGRHLCAGDIDAAGEALASLAPPQVDRIILQADFTATAPGEPTPQLRGELDLIADVESSGHATVWRMTETSLRRGFDAGRTSSAILKFLSEHATTEVPQPLVYLVEDLGRRYGQLRVGPATSYVRCDDPALLAEIQRSKKVAKLRLHLLAPTVAVGSRPTSEVVSTLRDAGFLPCAESRDGTISVTRPPTHRVDRQARYGDFGAVDLDSDDYGVGDPDLDSEMGSLLRAILGETLPGGSGIQSATDERRSDIAALAAFLERADTAGGELRFSEEDLDMAIDRLRRPAGASDAARANNPARANIGLVGPSPAGGGSRADIDGSAPRYPGHPEDRPNHIARDQPAIESLLRDAYACDWMVRMGYLTATGGQSEFSAEILGLKRGKVRLRYVDRHGGGELVIRRIQWARILTPDEEDLWL